MKKIKIILSIILLSSFSVMAQVSTPKKALEKFTAMKEQVKEDFQLTNEQAEVFYQIILEKFNTDAVEIKKLNNPEEKKAYWKESYIKTGVKYRAAFGEDQGKAIQKWVFQNGSKFDK